MSVRLVSFHTADVYLVDWMLGDSFFVNSCQFTPSSTTYTLIILFGQRTFYSKGDTGVDDTLMVSQVLSMFELRLMSSCNQDAQIVYSLPNDEFASIRYLPLSTREKATTTFTSSTNCLCLFTKNIYTSVARNNHHEIGSRNHTRAHRIGGRLEKSRRGE